jgi:hypothetical protein
MILYLLLFVFGIYKKNTKKKENLEPEGGGGR